MRPALRCQKGSWRFPIRSRLVSAHRRREACRTCRARPTGRPFGQRRRRRWRRIIVAPTTLVQSIERGIGCVVCSAVHLRKRKAPEPLGRVRFLTVTSEQFRSVACDRDLSLTKGMLTHFRFHSTRQTLKPYEAAHSFLSSTELRHAHARTVTTLAVAYCKVMLCNTHPMSVGSTGRKARESQRADV